MRHCVMHFLWPCEITGGYDWILISVSDCGVDKFSALFPVQFDRKLDEVYEDLATGEFCLFVCFPNVIGVNNVTIC